jgi:hypothetical protein
MKETKIKTIRKTKRVFIITGILLMLFFLFLKSALAVETNIDIGSPAIDRVSSYGAVATFISMDNPANLNGTITSVELYAYTTMTNVEIATFYIIGSNILSTRDNEYIGTVNAGSKQTFNVNISVQEGDFLGFYMASGTTEVSVYGPNWWSKLGDSIPAVNVTFTLQNSERTFSVYGIGFTSNTSSIIEEEGAVPAAPFEIDFENTASVIFLFIILLLYLGVMALGFAFKNGGFVSFGFFIGIVLGFMVSGYSMFLTLVFFFMNIGIFWAFIKKG